MLKKVDEIGESICCAYHFVNRKYPISLVMENAGSHGTICAKEEFEKMLRDNYKIHIIWQIPNSPDTNKLDLVTWYSIQYDVEEIHRRAVMDSDILVNSVEEGFVNLDTSKLQNISNRWKCILDLILKNSDGNDLVEK